MVDKVTYTDLQRQALGWTLVLFCAGTWICLLVADLGWDRLPTEVIGGAVATVIVCGILYALREKHLSLTSYFTTMLMWVFVAILSAHSPQPFLYLFGVVIMLSSRLLALPAVVMLTVATTTLVIVFAGQQEWIVGPVITIWGSLFACIIVSRGNYQALETVYRHHLYSLEQMNLARDHRAQVFKVNKALQEATEALRHANIQLRYARETADEARRLKAMFAANVSHELRTPINLVIGYSEVMVTAPEIYGAPLPPLYRGDIQAIYRNAKHLQDLINDILDISQIEAARLAITKQKVSLRCTLLEAADMVRDLVDTRGLQFNLELPDELPEVWIDSIRIRQVVLNLLANAVRFTDKGVITLLASHEQGEVTVSVKDTGIGISKADLERVFEEFYQIDDSLSSQHRGTGLGLTLSMHVVHRHGGRIWAESDGIGGHGSTFSFTIPVSADAKRDGVDPILQIATRQERKCVIIFDDDVAVGQLFQRYLGKHEVVISRSLDDALRLTETIQPSAIVLDQSRYSAEFEAYLGNCCPDTAIVYCAMPSGRRAVQAYGAADYLVKPLTRQALMNAIVGLGKPVQKILVIDDERDVTRLVTRMIEAYDQLYTILQANNGKDGLAIMQREIPDVVLLDIEMPGMDGFTIMDHMKQHPLLQQIPVIIASAHGAEEAIASPIEGKITMLRPSGFTPAELVNSVESLVSVVMPSNVVTPR